MVPTPNGRTKNSALLPSWSVNSASSAYELSLTGRSGRLLVSTRLSLCSSSSCHVQPVGNLKAVSDLILASRSLERSPGTTTPDENDEEDPPEIEEPPNDDMDDEDRPPPSGAAACGTTS